MRNKLKVYRAMHDLTQEALGEKLGVTRQTIISIESGKYDPSLGLAFKIAGSMGFKACFQKADPYLLEPIYNIDVLVPEEYRDLKVAAVVPLAISLLFYFVLLSCGQRRVPFADL